MDVIGNNIANVSTVGFKKSRVIFKDTLYQTLKSASSPIEGSQGGTNATSVGLGMSVASIDQITTGSTTSTTDVATDLAISGDGYFILGNGDQTYYTRAGNFTFDVNGDLISGTNSFNVLGCNATAETTDEGAVITFTPDGQATDKISIKDFATLAPKSTETMTFAKNLNSAAEVPQIGDPAANIDPTDTTQFPGENEYVPTSKTVYNSLGEETTVYFRFYKTGTSGADPDARTNWACDISLDPNFQDDTDYTAADFTETVDLTTATEDTPAAATLSNTTGHEITRVYNLQFNENGTIPDPTDSPWLSQFQLTVVGVPDATATTTSAVDRDIVATVDFNGLTQYDSESTAWVESQDGYAKGSLKEYSIGADGIVTGIYDNEQKLSLAQVNMASFQNANGLQQVGGSVYRVTVNSGDAQKNKPGSDGLGTLIPGSLEQSNVDLSEEFTSMIVTQRGFQANSRIITTSDEMLQELVNLKR